MLLSLEELFRQLITFRAHTKNDEWNSMTFPWLLHDQMQFCMTQKLQKIKESTQLEQTTDTSIQL